MNGNTVAVNPTFGLGPGSGPQHKRQRVEAQKPQRTTLRFAPTYQGPKKQGINGHTNVGANGTEAKGAGAKRTGGGIQASKPHPPQANSTLPRIATDLGPTPKTGPASAETPTRSSPRLVRNLQNGTHDEGPTTVDFDSAPDDDTQFIIWFMQQVSHFPGTASQDAEQQSRRQSIQSPYGSFKARASPADSEPTARLSDQAKLRAGNRERKKRWRESNTERNKDNDLRCRINKLAKTKYGTASSQAKKVFIEAEFQKRRAKREQKQRARATQTGLLPQLTIGPEAQANLFMVQTRGTNSNPESQARKLITEMLLSPDGSLNTSNRTQNEAARKLRTALKDGSMDKNLCVQVMRSFNPGVIKNIGAALEYDGDDEGQEEASGIDGFSGGDPISRDEEQQSPPTADASDMDVDLPPSVPVWPVSVDESNERIKAVNATLATLIEYADTKAYSSPYGSMPVAAPKEVTAEPSSSKEPPAKAPSPRPPPPAKTAKTAKKISLNPDDSQVDFLLHLAGGGSMTDDEDDDIDDDDQTISDLDEIMEDEPQIQADSEVKHVASFVIRRLVADKSGGQKHGVLSPTLPGAQSIDEQIAKVEETLAQAQLSVNVIMPSNLSKSTWQLYDWVSSRARSYTAPEEPKPAPSPAVVDNIPPRQSVPPPQLAPHTQTVRPQSVPPPPHPHHHMGLGLPPLPALLPPRPAGIPMVPLPQMQQRGFSAFSNRLPPLPPPSRSENEHKRIRMYGFPPHPGNRVGHVQRS